MVLTKFHSYFHLNKFKKYLKLLSKVKFKFYLKDSNIIIIRIKTKITLCI